MAEPRLRQRTFTWAPRTLAVISCALALLAAQPSASAAPTIKHRAIVLHAGGVAGRDDASAARSTPRAAARATQVALRQDDSLLASARNRHILATVEILQRLLISELRPAQRDMLPAIWFETVCVGILQPTAVPHAGGIETRTVPVPIVERAFAIRHCLLAPPIS